MNNECIHKSEICNGEPNCSDGSDEHSCSLGNRCEPNQFLCKNTKCVDRTWRCDGEDDCGDKSDEESCDPEPSGSPCRYNEFQCNTGHCVPKTFQCDKLNDCLDGSDEIGCGKCPTRLKRDSQYNIYRCLYSQAQGSNQTCAQKVSAGGSGPEPDLLGNWCAHSHDHLAP